MGLSTGRWLAPSSTVWTAHVPESHVGSAEPHSGHLGFIAQPFSAAFASSFRLLFLLFFCSLYFPLFSPLPPCLSLLSSFYSSVSYQFSFSHLPFHLPFIFYFSPFSFPRSPLFDSFTFCFFSSSSCPFPSHFGAAPFRTSSVTNASFYSVSTWLCSVEGMSPGPHWPPLGARDEGGPRVYTQGELGSSG